MSRPSDTLTTHSSTAARVGAGRGRGCLGSLGADAARARAPAVRLLGRGRAPAAVRDDRRVRAGARPRSGFDSVWLSDHLFLDLAKYGGAPDREACFDPIVTLAALARRVPGVRLGTLVLLRGAAAGVGARQGAGDARSRERRSARRRARRGLVRARVRRDRHGDAAPGRAPRPLDRSDRGRDGAARRARRSPSTGAHHRADAARSLPGAVQQPRPRVFVGGKGDRLLRLVAEHADGWNTCWTWTPEAYRERADVLDARASVSVAIRRRCGGRSGSTRCAARTSAISSAASSGWPRKPPPGVLRRRRPRGVPRRPARRDGRRGARAGSASGRRSASTRSSLGVGAVPFHVARARRRRARSARARRLTRSELQAERRSRGRGGGAGCGAVRVRTRRPTRRARCGSGARTRGTRRAPGTPRTRAAPFRRRYRRTGRTRSGLTPRHRAWNIHAYSSGVSSTVTSTSTNPTAFWFPWFTFCARNLHRRDEVEGNVGDPGSCSFLQRTLSYVRKPFDARAVVVLRTPFVALRRDPPSR